MQPFGADPPRQHLEPSLRIDWLPTTKKAAHANYTMSAVEELAKLPGYSDDGLTAVVHDPRGHQFYFEPLPPVSASSSLYAYANAAGRRA